MKRSIDDELKKWQERKERKVLLLRGARQIGKTYSIRKLAESFAYFLEVNFEENPHLCSFFKDSLNPLEINERLSFYFNIPIKPGQTLVFFDEIQACPEALRSLRFYYEKMPALHVAAAGSLLEFALSEIPSFGVGRIESMYMYPMTFFEFLEASGSGMLNEAIKAASVANPMDPVIHNKILERLKIFLVIGGMPRVVNTYIHEQNLAACQVELDNLLNSLYDDFAKYKTKVPVLRLQETFKSVVYQTGNKFKYTSIQEGVDTHPYKDALELLVRAGLVYKVFHSSASGLPLGGQITLKKFKTLVFDTGIFQRVQGLDISEHIISDFSALVNRGNLCELFTGLELIAGQIPRLRPEIYYWHREARASNAEVDYVISHHGQVIPIEVKSGLKGQMQSLYLFLEEKKLPLGLRVSSENFTAYDKIKTIPLYAIPRIYHLS
ncbi:MAG: AAA family ATPase [Candidatus Aminicenantes bacterium]|nr:AAA family ATPase [Candidatus Aminicenantes bacterium]